MEVGLTVNGIGVTLEVDPADRLIDVLRNHIGLTGVKEGCGKGECGACTVIVDGKPVNACLLLAVQAGGKDITTIEGLSPNGRLDDLQQAFVDNGAIQCGYCTPGMIMSAKALLMNESAPSEDRIKDALAGNLCRCTGYVNIVQAIKSIGKPK